MLTELNFNYPDLSTEDEFNKIIIIANDDKIVRLSDIGRAELGSENLETEFKANDQSMVAMAIIPQPGTNYIDIAEQFYIQYEAFQKDLPKDIKLNIVLDNTIFISLAFAFTVSWTNIAIMILVHFTIMFIWTFIAQPITVKVTKWAKKGEPITA